MRPDTTGSAEVSLGHVWRIKFKSHTHTNLLQSNRIRELQSNKENTNAGGVSHKMRWSLLAGEPSEEK